MKTIILAGGFGSRLAELTDMIPKPMVPIGEYPILWHIMKIYATHGLKDFVVACGYKSEVIKKYFYDFHIANSDFSIDLASGRATTLSTSSPDWNVTLVDTGLGTMTGGRLLRLKNIVGNETCLLTYGDAVGNVDVKELLKFHRAHGKLATVTAVRPPARFGALELNSDAVTAFSEKPQVGEGWINGGFFVFEPGVFNYLEDDQTVLERKPLERLANDGQLMAYKHDGYWQPMDTLREKHILEGLWESGEAPWKVW